MLTETINIQSNELRYDYTLDDILALFDMPFVALMDHARKIHQKFHPKNNVQLASLLSIKTGYCPENCNYCPQSAHFAKETGLEKSDLMDVDHVLDKAEKAKQAGASRFCMGAAWRCVKDGDDFDKVIEMVKGVKEKGMEACVTLGMLTDAQAQRLADAGLTAYNHNIDTSPEFYDKIITTRRFEDRMNTLNNVRQSGVHVCCGGILGMGESVKDRASMLRVLTSMKPHPESVPINALVASKGTPLEHQEPVDPIEFVRMIAVTRILMPHARIRLSAGRKSFSKETQIMAFYVGANSIFYGEKLLTTENNDAQEDLAMLQQAGLNIEGHNKAVNN